MRRRRAPDAGRFSLFPFLAVLLCTMGSLIVLLLILVQQSRVQAAQERGQSVEVSGQSEEHTPEDLDALRNEAERLAARASELDELRGRYREQLENSRLSVAHLEDHIRRLREQFAKLNADYQVMQQSHEQDLQSTQQKLAELARMRSQIDEAKAELDEAKRAADARPRSYAIIPYEGPRGTRRRPIYIECRADQLIIQPEGVVLLPDDFAGPLDAGNPLAAALRATREYLSETGSLQGGEPYPLLLVRPDGAQMYAAAMGAMQSWSSENGYELIDADMDLAMPPADEALGEVVRRTVNLARQRNVMMARARNTLGGGGGRGRSYGGIGPGSGTGGAGGSYLSVSRNGGFQMHGGSRASDDWLQRQVSAADNPALGGHGNGGEENGGARGTGPFYGTEQAGTGSAGTGSGQGTNTLARSVSEGPGTNPLARSVSEGTGQSPTGVASHSPGQSPTAVFSHRQSPTGTASQGSNSGSAAFAPAGDNAVDQNAPSAGQFGSTAGTSPDGTSATASQSAGGTPGGSPGQGATSRGGGMPSMAATAPPPPSQQGAPPNTLQTFSPPPQALAQARGENWALPRSAQGATTFHRPIRVECHADKLLVLPDRGGSERSKVTQLSGPLESSIDNFVADLWQHMNAWGIAGPQSYWKPVLRVEVAPDGEARFRELAALMQKSGVEVQRK